MSVQAVSGYSPSAKATGVSAETKSTPVSIKFTDATNSTNNSVGLSLNELTPKQQLTLSIAQDQLGKFYDVTMNKDGMLIITANNNKSIFGFPSSHLLGYIKNDLALEDGVIAKNNEELYDPSSAKFERFDERPSLLDMASLRVGSSIQIPFDEVGKKPNFFQRFLGTFDDLQE